MRGRGLTAKGLIQGRGVQIWPCGYQGAMEGKKEEWPCQVHCLVLKTSRALEAREHHLLLH